MGANSSKQALKNRRNQTSQSISTDLDNSSSSYYSNYEELRKVKKESNCLGCFNSQTKPNWLQFFHAKCDKLILNNVPWAYDGKLISELRGKRDYRGEYDDVFQANIKKIRPIMSDRPSVHIEEEEEAPQNMNNLLADLNITQNPSTQQVKGLSTPHRNNSNYKADQHHQKGSEQSGKRSERHFGSSHQTSNNENEFYSVKSDLMSNPTPIHNNIGDIEKRKKSSKYEDQSQFMSCKSNNNNNQKEDAANISGYLPTNYNHNIHNNSFPSYMLENQFQGLRAGNVTMMKMTDPETNRKNLSFYFECTARISSHLDDANFTLFQIRQLFITSFFSRYSDQIKKHREQLDIKKKQEEEILNRNQTSAPSDDNPYSQFQQQQNSLPSPNIIPVYQEPQKHGHQSNYIYNNISSQRFSSEEKFSPLADAFSIYKNALREFQYFVKLYMEVIKQYYDIHYKKNKQMDDGLKELFSYHNFQNFVISKLFQNEKIPKILIELIKLVIPDDKDLISSVDRSKLTPQMFGIPAHLSLDDDTRKIMGCSPHYTSSEAFGSIKEEFDEYEDKSLQQINANQPPNHQNHNQNQLIYTKVQDIQGNPLSDQNAINSDKYTPKESSFTDTVDSDPSSKYNSHQKPIVAPLQKATQQTKQEEEDYEIGESDEDQDIIFELKITNKAKTQFTQYYQQNDPLRGNSNIFSSEQSSQIKNEINADLQNPTKKVNPYQKCLDYIEQMKNSTTPTGKFKSIILACESIQKCIQEFYKQNGRTFNQALDEESIISILTYLIAQTGYFNIEAHCKFVHSFYKNPTKKLKLKYYLIAFEISVRNVQELYYNLSQQEKKQNNGVVQGDKSPKSIFKKNLNKKLNENFSGDSSNPRILMNITGRNSILKQTLAEVKQ